MLAQLARTRMRLKIPLLEEAFVGHFTGHHAFLHETRIAQLGTPLAGQVAKLDEIPGIGVTTVDVIAARGIATLRGDTPCGTDHDRHESVVSGDQTPETALSSRSRQTICRPPVIVWAREDPVNVAGHRASRSQAWVSPLA